MIDIVIPLTEGSKNKNIELRYTLRSVEKYLRNVNKVFIVGHCPNWIQNVAHLPFKEYDAGAKQKEKNIFTKTLVSLRYVTAGSFLFMNDDHFLLSEFDATDFPLYYTGTLKAAAAAREQRDPYYKVLRNTMDLLGEMKLNYDAHCPMIFYSDVLLRLERFWVKDYGYCLKTFHRYWQTECDGMGTPCVDLKIRDQLSLSQIQLAIEDLKFFSTSDEAVNNDMICMLEALYPNKSVFEV